MFSIVKLLSSLIKLQMVKSLEEVCSNWLLGCKTHFRHGCRQAGTTTPRHNDTVIHSYHFHFKLLKLGKLSNHGCSTYFHFYISEQLWPRFSAVRTFCAVGLEPGRKAGIRPAQVATLSQCVQTALYYCVKRKLSVDPCWPSVYSAESGPISLGINAQRGTSIQRPRNSLSQPLPFTAPWPLSDTHRKTVSLPHQSLFRCPALSSQTPASRCITVWAPVWRADPALA